MKLNNRFAPYVLTAVVLLTLGLLVFRRSGTYRIVWGSGMFAGASDMGSYRDKPDVVKRPEAYSVALQGTICY